MENPPIHKKRFRFWIGSTLLLIFVAGMWLSSQTGITWDEGPYVSAGYHYLLWVKDLSFQNIDTYWDLNHEHPPAAKLFYGLAGIAENGDILMSILTARYAAVFMFVVLIFLVFSLVSEHFSCRAGVFAALALLLMPRVVGHGCLATLDMPVTMACFAVTTLFLRAHKNRGFAIAAGAAWGVALLTKINAIFLPLILIPWAAWYYRKKAIQPCVLLLLVGGLIFFLGWPWLWPKPAARIRNYALNKTERLSDNERPAGTSNIPVYYFGKIYTEKRVPFHYPAVMVLITIPAGLLAFFGVGVRRIFASERRGPPEILLFYSGLLHLFVFMLPWVPKYDGIRLFLPAFPYIACLAGVGASRIWHWKNRAGKGLVTAAYALSAFSLCWTVPFQLSYYNELVGGAWGAEKLGFETTYWGDTLNSRVMSEVNKICPDGSRIAAWPPYHSFLPALPWLKKELIWLKEWSPEQDPPEFLLIFPRQGYLGEVQNVLKGADSVRDWKYLGVPQAILYRTGSGNALQGGGHAL